MSKETVDLGGVVCDSVGWFEFVRRPWLPGLCGTAPRDGADRVVSRVARSSPRAQRPATHSENGHPELSRHFGRFGSVFVTRPQVARLRGTQVASRRWHAAHAGRRRHAGRRCTPPRDNTGAEGRLQGARRRTLARRRPTNKESPVAVSDPTCEARASS